MKSLIFNGIHTKASKDLIREILKSRSDLADLISIRSLDVTLDPSELKNTRYLDVSYGKAIQGDYDFPPESVLDSKILSQLGNDWFILLKMVDRMSPSSVVTYQERMDLLFKHIRYWNYILDTRKVDCFVGTNYPHEIYDYVIYSLCKAKKIKTLFFAQTQMIGYLQLLEDIESNDPRLVFDIPSNAEVKGDLPPIMQKHWEMQTGKFVEPFYMVKNKEQINAFFSSQKKSFLKKTLNFFRKLLGFPFKWFKINYLLSNTLIWERYYHSLFSPEEELALAEAYEKVARVPDVEKKFIYLPLHFQPECTTSPQAGFFVHQEFIVELLLKTLPSGVALYVKEHPMQRLHGRTKNFYEKFSNYANLVFVRKDFDSQVLLQHCLAVATATGTAGWEGLFKNKPVLHFGFGFYQYAPGVYRIRSKEDCLQAVQKILSGQEQNIIGRLHYYLSKSEPLLVRGWIDQLYEGVSHIDYAENIRNLSKALNAKI